MTWASTPTAGGWIFGKGYASIVVDYIRSSSHGLDAWVELRWKGQDVPISEGSRNLMSPTWIRPFIEDAKRSKHGTAPDWEAGLRLAAHTVIEAHRDGAATQDLATVDPKPVQFLIEPLVEHGNATRLIAAGGSGKSIFALGLGLTVATGRRFVGLTPTETGPVLYLDWETDADTHARRIRALCRAVKSKPPDRDLILYRSESVPLFRTAQVVRRIADSHGVVFIVVDSIRMAAGPSGQSSGEDAALSLYLALREIGRPALLIDHKSKDDIAKERRGGYGSVYYKNLARMEWEMTRLSRISPTQRSFVLELEKENNVGARPPLGFIMELVGGDDGLETARFEQANPDNLADPTADDLPDRIAAVLSVASEPMDVAAIAAMLFGAEDGPKRTASIRTRLNQDPRFENVSQTKVGMWRMEGQQTDAGDQGPLMPPPAEWDGNPF